MYKWVVQAINCRRMFSRDSTISSFLSGLRDGDPARKPDIATDLSGAVETLHAAEVQSFTATSAE